MRAARKTLVGGFLKQCRVHQEHRLRTVCERHCYAEQRHRTITSLESHGSGIGTCHEWRSKSTNLGQPHSFNTGRGIVKLAKRGLRQRRAGGGIDNKFANSINVPSRTKGGVKAVRSMERQGDQEPPPRGHQQRTYRHNIKHHRFDNVSQPGGEGGDRLSINRASTFGRHPKGGEGQCLYEWPCPNGASTSHRLGIDKAARVATRDREVACEYVNVNVNV